MNYLLYSWSSIFTVLSYNWGPRVRMRMEEMKCLEEGVAVWGWLLMDSNELPINVD